MAGRGRISQAKSVVAPVGGLNDRDSMAAMGENYALTLENWFPMPRGVRSRGGSALVSHIGVNGETLMPYNGTNKKLFCAVVGGGIYDTATNPGTLQTVTCTNGRLDHINFSNTGGSYLVAVNGTNAPIFYNGTSWTSSGVGYAAAITDASGLLSSVNNFTQVSSWKNRLFFVEKNKLRCWYLGVGAIGGAAKYIDFGGVSKLGGFLVATYTLSSSAGVTPDDYFVAITSEGECLIYRGTDPDSAATFGIVGNYRIGRPIANGVDKQGGRFLSRFGSDVVAITADGFTMLQDMIETDVVAGNKSLNEIIINTITSDVTSYASNFGWQVLLAPMQNKLIFNVPAIEYTYSYQYVMNTITGAWCKFSGWDATCFQVFNDKIYAFFKGAVYEVDVDGFNDYTGSAQGDEPIFCTAKTAFVYYGGSQNLKSYKLIRPLIYATGDIAPNLGLNVDFEDRPIVGDITIGVSGKAIFGVAIFGVDLFSSESVLYSKWSSVNGIGYCAAASLSVYTNNQTVDWHGYTMQYEIGGTL